VTNVKALGGEQSNSTVIVDADYVLKFYRRIRSGQNPEVELGRFLTDSVNYQNAPPLLGSMELVEGEETTALAVLHGFVENQGDGWALTAAYLDRFLDEQRVLTPDAPAHQHDSFVQRVRQIGRRLGELHLALASRPDDADFAPEPVSGGDLRGWTETLLASFDQVIDELQRRRSDLRDNARPMAEGLATNRSEAVERIRNLLPTEVEALRIRDHGDLHLGQILIVKDDIFITDFEGEPERVHAERRRKNPGARDLGGFIRSIDYAAATALDRVVKTSPEDQARLTRALESWRKETLDGFLAAYQETIGASPLWPKDLELGAALIDFFVIDKAIYEIGYELANRPGWLHVPLAGLYRALFPDAEEATA
jgi:maltose alpha-D-glucosyltransferase/alpha-amylase